MSKIFYLVFAITVLLVILIGLFLWSSYSEEMDNFIPAVEIEPPENYEIIETEEGKFVENSNVGLKFKVPEGWDVKKEEIQPNEWVVNVTSPDIKFGEDGMLSEGCGFSVWVERDETTANLVRDRINNPEEYKKEISGNYESLFIDKKNALKMVLQRENWGEIVYINIPLEDRIIKFDTFFRPNTREMCSSEFSAFLSEIKIN